MGRNFVLSLLVSMLLVSATLALLPVGVRAHEPEDEQEFETVLNDRFDPSRPGAEGEVEGEVIAGVIVIEEFEAEGLPLDHPLLIVVAFGPFDFDDFADFLLTRAPVFTFAVRTDDDGEFEMEDLEIITGLAPGTYRMDFFVVHPHPTDVLPLSRTLLLACIPAISVTV